MCQKRKKGKKIEIIIFFSKDKIKPRIIEILHVFYAYNNPYISKTWKNQQVADDVILTILIPSKKL